MWVFWWNENRMKQCKNESNLDNPTLFLGRLHNNKSSLLNLKLPLGQPVVLRKLNRSIDLLGLGLYCLTQTEDQSKCECFDEMKIEWSNPKMNLTLTTRLFFLGGCTTTRVVSSIWYFLLDNLLSSANWLGVSTSSVWDYIDCVKPSQTKDQIPCEYFDEMKWKWSSAKWI